MQSKSDAQLLREYAETGAEPAFTEIVHRHTNLVYSAALRQVESPEAAAEIAQKVFVGLARGARELVPRLAAEASLAGWLCRSARNLSLNFRRDEFRRQTRERQAMEQLSSISDAPDWERLRVVLDDAMSELTERDYDALVLRFFENRDFRSVGQALGMSDDAAQKCVSRALEKLREHFSRRNINTTAAALSIAISANAVQAAPIGLAASISTAAGIAGTIATVGTATVAKAIAMTTLQKTLVASTIAVLVGGGIYQARQAKQLRDQVQTLQQQQAPLAEQIQQLQKSLADATNRLVSLLAENSRLKSNSSELEILKLRGAMTRLQGEKVNSETSPAKAWQDRIEKLRTWLDSKPDATIPEFQFLTEDDWLIAIRRELKNSLDYRIAAAQLRAQAESKFVPKLQSALKHYLEQNGGRLPTDTTQLKSYFNQPVEDAILARWTVLPAESIADLRLGGDAVVTQKEPIDDVFDTRYGVGPNGSGSTDFLSSENREAMTALFTAFSSANPGRNFGSYSELSPYAETPAQKMFLQKLIEQQAGNK